MNLLVLGLNWRTAILFGILCLAALGLQLAKTPSLLNWAIILETLGQTSQPDNPAAKLNLHIQPPEPGPASLQSCASLGTTQTENLAFKRWFVSSCF
jgi:hypothetical protein